LFGNLVKDSDSLKIAFSQYPKISKFCKCFAKINILKSKIQKYKEILNEKEKPSQLVTGIVDKLMEIVVGIIE
jgi:hypothetical protein